MALLQDVRDSCAWVCERARDVHILIDRIDDYAATLESVPPVTELDPRYHLTGAAEETVAFILALDSVNFGSGWFPLLDKSDAPSGYFKVALSLKRWFDTAGPPLPKELINLTAAECQQLFGQGRNDQVGELTALFAHALNDLGEVVAAYGSYSEFVAAAGGRAEQLMAQLIEMPLFRDTAAYGGRTISFYKRAQIAVCDLALALHGQGLGYFEDVDRLTCFADNLVPHVLHEDGVIEYSSKLATMIDAGEVIPAGSAEEVEIRAAAVHAVELIVQAMAHRQRVAFPARVIDNILWERGHEERYKLVPRHRTRSTFY